MTLAEIKREINLRLREVKADSFEYSDTTSYATLQNLIGKAIERVAKCTSGNELEAIDNLLGVIEDCYNDCRIEKDGNASPVSLFDFQFELDVEADESKVADDGNEAKEESDAAKEESDSKEEIEEEVKQAIDVSRELAEIEDNYEKLYNECNFINRIKLGSLRKKAITSIRSASENAELVTEVYKFRRKFKSFSKRIEKAKCYSAAKPVYDELHITQNLTKTNIARLIFAIITVVGGAAYGLFEARWWPWENIAYAITGIGVAYLIISLIYAIVISKSVSKSATRRLCVMRMVLAIIFAVICLPTGLIFDELGLGTFYLATVPFTLCGAVIYLAYRLKLAILVRKKKK